MKWSALLFLVACGKSEPAQKPADPPKPAEPAKPAEPVKPAEPAKPAEPTKPAAAAAPKVVELPAEYERRDLKDFLVSLRVPKDFKESTAGIDDFVKLEGPSYFFYVTRFNGDKSAQGMVEAKEQITTVDKETFVKFTVEWANADDTEWRLDWDEKDGLAGTTARIHMKDCGATGLKPADRDLVAAMCASMQKSK